MSKKNPQRTIIPFYYLLEGMACTCKNCGASDQLSTLFSAMGTETTAVNLIPVSKPQAALWDVPVRYRTRAIDTAFCRVCIEGAKRTPVPESSLPIPNMSNFLPPKKPGKAPKKKLTVGDVL